MISAIRPTDNKTSFTSVVPIKVKIDGNDVYSEKLVRPAVLKLTSTLAGPANNNPKWLEIIRKFGLIVPDYSITKGINGYPLLFGEKKVQPSNYFRYIYDERNFLHYLYTGKHAEKVREAGKQVGIERQAAKLRNDTNSLDLKVAQANYYTLIKQFMRNKALRLTESFNHQTQERIGEPVSLVLHLSSNKKYGEKGFKMQLDDISFTKSS